MLATCVFSTLQHLLVGCEMEARRCVELTEGSRAVATITQMNPAYYEASGPPSWPLVSWARHAAPNPCSRRHSHHHHRISRRTVDLVEGAARQSGAEARERCGRAATPPRGYGARLGHRQAGRMQRTEVAVL
jgi:hypothetical protein